MRRCLLATTDFADGVISAPAARSLKLQSEIDKPLFVPVHFSQIQPRLDLTDLDLKDRTVRVTGKGSKTRVLPVGRRAVEALGRWLAERGSVAPAGERALFVSRRGRLARMPL